MFRVKCRFLTSTAREIEDLSAVLVEQRRVCLQHSLRYPRRQLDRCGFFSRQNLKTAEELENEDREAQSAKLQELIRRGTPRDLAQAQELMKTLAGANPEAKPDYKTQALTELNKLESKVILLNEMLDNVDTERGERFAQGDVYDVRTFLLDTLFDS